MLKDYLVTDDDKELVGDYKYNLISNIVHEGLPGENEGTYHAQVYHKVRTPAAGAAGPVAGPTHSFASSHHRRA